jgi:phosphatidylglycerophosphatase A
MRSATSSTPGSAGTHGPRKRNAAVVVSTLFGAGYFPGAPGTLGAALGIPVAVVLRLAGLPVAIEASIPLALVACAVLITARAEKAFGRHDPPQIVLDEFVSIPVTLFLVPLAWYWYALGFGLNRLLDVLKPPPIRQLQRLPGGWGIVADDLAAAVVANVVLHALVRLLA